MVDFYTDFIYRYNHLLLFSVKKYLQLYLEQTVTQSEVEAPAVSVASDNVDSQSTVAPTTSSSSITREVNPVTTVMTGARDNTTVSSVREGQSLGKRTREEAEGYYNIKL